MAEKNTIDSVTREFSENFPELYRRLDEVRVISDRKIQALCPAHDDHGPSLNLEIKDTDEGGSRLVFNCFICEDQEKVREALGLDWSAFYPKNGHRKNGTLRTVATYDYVDLAGELLYRVLRKQDEHGNKEFPQYSPDGAGGFLPGIDGVPRVPYRLPQITEAIKLGRPVAIVEGEKDAHTGEEMVPDLAWTTNSGGAKKFSEELVPHFIGADIVLLPDNDPAGEKHMSRAAELLLPVARRLRVVKLPGLEDKGDFTDWTKKLGHTREEFLELLEGAPLFEPDEKKANGLFGAVRLVDLGPPKPRRFLIGTLMPKGHITMLYGAGGVTKSYVALLVAVSVAAGCKDVFGYPIQESGPVLYMDFELDQDEQRNRVEEVCNGLGIPIPQNIIYFPASEYTTKEAFERAHKICELHNVVSVVVDSLGWALDGDMSSATDTLAFYRRYVTPLRAKLDVTPLIVHHQSRLTAGEKTSQKGVFGSVYNENMARSIIQIERRKVDQDGDGVLLRFRPKKANIGPGAPAFGQRVRFREGKVEFEAWEVPLVSADEDAEEAVPAPDLIVGALTQGPKTKVELQQITGLAESTINNNLSSLIRDEKVVKLSEKLGRHSLYALPEQKPPKGDDDPDSGPGGLGELGPSDEVRDRDEPAENGAGEPYSPTYPPGQSEVSKVADSEGCLAELVREVRAAEVVAFDFETGSVEEGTALDPVRCKPGVLSIAYPGAGADGIVLQVAKVDPRPLLAAMQGKTVIAHNAKFDLSVAKHHYGYEHDGPVFDPMVANRLIHFAMGKRVPERHKRKVPEQRIGESLVDLGKKYLNVEINKDEQTSDWLVDELSAEQHAYARMDAAILLPLKKELEDKIHELGLKDVLELEMRDTPALVWMETAGMPISEEKWLTLAQKAEKARDAAEAEVIKLLPEHPGGGRWNIGSDAQLRKILGLLGADLSKLPETDTTKEPSMSEKSLKMIETPEPTREFVGAFLRYRSAAKLASTYGKGWLEPPLFRPKARVHKWTKKRQEVIDGRLYTEFQQLVRSGRFSSKEPNVQNLPRLGGYREALETDQGRVLVHADYSQIEVLIASALAPDTKMYQAFQKGDDVHSNTARLFLGGRKVSEEEFKEYRAKAKAITFGMLYGMGPDGLVDYARDTFGAPLTRDEAKEYKVKFFEAYSGFAAWHDRESKEARNGNDLVRTPLGRARLVSLVPKKGDVKQWRVDFNERVNHPVQGAKADGTKVTLARLYESRHTVPGNAVPVDLIHDAFAVECDEEHVEEVKKWLLHHMIEGMREGTGFPDLPVKVESSISNNFAGK